MAADKTDKVDVTVRLDRAEAERLEEIVNSLKERGLTNVEPHSRFMIVNGTAKAADLESLRQVKGVASVREDKTYKPQEE